MADIDLIPALLERMAAATPSAPAAEDKDQVLTYAQLHERVNYLANQIIKTGVQVQDRVGVMMGHTCDLLVALLAILRAGAVYVPIDPQYPGTRKQFLAADSGITLLITDPGEADIPSGIIAPTIWPGKGSDLRCDRSGLPGPDDLACIIYTSGSTGTPKGVMIPHRGLSNLALAAKNEFSMTAQDRYLMLASASFSASLEELFPPLACGATSVFPPERSELTPVHSLLDFIDAKEITLAELQTAHWHVLVRYLAETGRDLPPSLRLIVMGGDRPLADAVRQWNSFKLPLVHVYGPTETTATATYWTILAGHMPEDGILSIGDAIPRTRLFIVDPYLRLVRTGEPGELLVGGDSVAHGYLNHPGATAERFLPDAFSGVDGAVLYRTGDLVRQLPDGRLRFLGRADEQVKVSGYRIELAEVETALLQHPAVRQALVEPWLDAQDRLHLAGYVIADEDSVTPADLRRLLAKILPSYMIPSTFICLDDLPLTLHRKIDRAALPSPMSARTRPEADYVEPADDIERAICEIAAELLGVAQIGTADNLHDIGADSQFMLLMIVRLDSRFHVRISFREAFEIPTVQGIAELMRRSLPKSAGKAMP